MSQSLDIFLPGESETVSQLGLVLRAELLRQLEALEPPVVAGLHQETLEVSRPPGEVLRKTHSCALTQSDSLGVRD